MYSQLTLENSTVQYEVDDCNSEAAKCVKMNNTQWMPFVTIGDFHNETTGRIANLSTYIVPQFYT